MTEYINYIKSRATRLLIPYFVMGILYMPLKYFKNTPISSSSISFNTQNLFTISAKALRGQDPSQAGFSQPNLSVRPSYTVGLSVSFN